VPRDIDNPPTLLALYRLRAGVTQEELAKKIGISIASYQRVERGLDHDPPIGWLANAAKALGVGLHEILEDEMVDEWHPYNSTKEPDPSWRERPEMKARAARWAKLNPHLAGDD